MNESQNPNIVGCAIYLRSATDERASLLRQEQACRAAAAGQTPTWQIVEDAVFSDATTSGRTYRDRPGLAALLQKAAERPRPIDLVLVESPDRLGRDLAVLSNILNELTHHGVGIYFAALGFDSSDPSFRSLFSRKHHYDEQSSRAASDRIRHSRRGVLHQRRFIGGRSYGYGNRVVHCPTDNCSTIRGVESFIVEHEAEVVRRIFGEFAEGRSLATISRRLNSEGVPRLGGVAWNPTSIRRILFHPRYRGTVLWTRSRRVRNSATSRAEIPPRPEAVVERVHVPHLRIVDDELAARVDARLKKTDQP